MSEYYLAEVISLLFLAFALGMDAFSIGLGIGMQRIRLKRMALVGITIGIFHIFMPFLGMIFGQVISAQIGEWATLAGGLLLVGIGAQMFFSAFNHDSSKVVQPIGFGLFMIGFSVSIDSFSVGLSLGISGVSLILALFFFGTFSMVLSWAGMLVGRKVRGFLGVYSGLLGGSILIGFGLNVLFG